ncbi:hypothetical protein ACWFMI_14525 [Nocardiopsis terrae]
MTAEPADPRRTADELAEALAARGLVLVSAAYWKSWRTLPTAR